MTKNKSSNFLQILIRNLTVGLLYFLGAQLGFLIALPPGNVTALWPPAGIALSAMVILGWKASAAGIFIGSLMANAGQMSGSNALLVSMSIAAASTLQYLIGGYLIRRVAHIPPETSRDALLAILISVSIPLIASTWGVATLCVLGFSAWTSYLSLVWAWWVGDSVGILLIAPWMVILGKWIIERKKQPVHLLWPITSFIAGLSLFIFFAINLLEDRLYHQSLLNDTTEIGIMISDTINHHDLENLQAAQAFFYASREVSQEEFSRFSSLIYSNLSSANSIAWVEVVQADERDAYESRNQFNGQDSFQIHRGNSGGGSVPSPQLNEYYPITYIEPKYLNLDQLGYDNGSSPPRLKSLLLARDTGQTVISELIKTDLMGQATSSILLIAPVYKSELDFASIETRRANIRGFIIGSIFTDNLISSAISELTPLDLELYLYDVERTPEFINFYPSLSGQQTLPSPPQIEELTQGHFQTYEIEAANRTWMLIARPQSSYMTANQWIPWASLVIGFVLTGGVLLLFDTRQKAEAALVKSEAEFRSLSDYALTGVMRYEISSGKVLYANESAAQMFGITDPGQFTGSDLGQFIQPPEKYSELSKLLTQNRKIREFEFNAGGSAEEHTLLLSASLYQDVVNATLVDLTDRIRAGQEFRQLSHIVSQMADTVVVTDAEGNIQYVNAAFEKSTGYAAADVMGKTPRILKSGYHDASYYKALWDVILRGEVFTGEFKNKRKNGGLFFEMKTITPILDTQGRVVNFIATGKDITDRKLAEEQLAASEQRNKTLVDAIPDILFRVSRDGTFIDYKANPSNKLYVPPEVFIGKKFADVLPPDIVQLSTDVLKRAFESNKLQTYEYSLWTGDVERIYEGRMVANLGSNEAVIIIRDVTDQRKMERDIRESEERYRLLSEELEQRVIQRTAEIQDLYDNAPTGYHSLDSSGVFLMMNKTELRWLGYSAEEVIGKLRFSDLIIPEEMPNFKRDFQKLLDNGHVENLEFNLQKKDGSLLPVIINATGIFDEQGRFLHSRSNMFDNTERKKAQEALRQSEATYRALFENSNDAIFLLSPEGKELQANQRALDMLEYSREEYFARSSLDSNFMAPSYEQADAQTKFNAALRGEIVPLYERVFHSRKGRRIDVEINLSAVTDSTGKVILVQSVVRDITQRKAIEAEIRRAKALSDTALELAQAGYWHAPLDGSGQFVSSDRVIAIQGDPPRSNYRYHLKNEWMKNIRLANAELGEKVEQSLREILTGAADVFDVEYAYLRPLDGQVVWLHTIGNIVRDADGRRMAISGVTQNITQQKDMESELKKARDAAQTANLAKSTFLANMSHEIRTPMNAILGFAQIILRDQKLDEKIRGYMEIINRSGEHLLTLINDILEMSKIEAGHVTYNPVSFNLPAMIHDLRSMFDPRLEAKNLFMEIDLDPQLAEYVVSDENKVKEILINLIGNAVKFTKQGGITIHARTEHVPENALSHELFLYLDVADTGPGILPTDIPRLFRAFEQTRTGAQTIGGTGLGLAISQSHATLMGGEITVESTPGKGSIFHVRIKVQPGEAVDTEQEIQPRTVSGLLPGIQEVRILIADDHEENRLVLKELLESVGIKTMGAENGLTTLEAAATWDPDLVLMDLRMPVMDGYEASRNIKKLPAGANIPIVAITASILELDREKLSAASMDGVLRKPFKDYELFQMIEDKLGTIFTYADASPVKSLRVEQEETRVTPETLSEIPANLIDKITSATRNARFDEILSSIEESAAYSPLAAKKLQALANEFKYDEILEILGKA